MKNKTKSFWRELAFLSKEKEAVLFGPSYTVLGENEFLVDEDNNVVSMKKLGVSIEKAKKTLKSLKGCEDCWDCLNCLYCNYCYNLENGIFCYGLESEVKEAPKLNIWAKIIKFFKNLF